jgi:dipeptidase E
MKLLLTSDGITNKSIAKALFELVGKEPDQTNLAFIPTGMNMARGDKGWFVDMLYQIKGLGFKNLDIVDISALPKNVWLPKLEAADVLFFSGGNSLHLMNSIKKSGLKELLAELLKTKVYASNSAGSTITAFDLNLSNPKYRAPYKEIYGYDENDGLNLVNFYTQSHLNSPLYPERTEEHLKELAKSLTQTLYAIDHNSALKVIDGKVEIVSEGKYLKLN